jgi:hypothetical protein
MAYYPWHMLLSSSDTGEPSGKERRCSMICLEQNEDEDYGANFDQNTLSLTSVE